MECEGYKGGGWILVTINMTHKYIQWMTLSIAVGSGFQMLS